MNFEGIVLQITPFKERDVITKSLLRNGTIKTFYVYGGQGGGKSFKPRKVEVGKLVRFETKGSHARDSKDLKTTSSVKVLWEPQKIRHDFQAYGLMCFFLEMTLKVSPHLEVDDETFAEYEGLFNVVSNGLFYLDESLAGDFNLAVHLNLFLCKFLYHLGVFPDTSHCMFCACELKPPKISFNYLKGGFSCLSCTGDELNDGMAIWQVLKTSQGTRYQDYQKLDFGGIGEGKNLINFFCQQFNLKPFEMSSYDLLFRS